MRRPVQGLVRWAADFCGNGRRRAAWLALFLLGLGAVPAAQASNFCDIDGNGVLDIYDVYYAQYQVGGSEIPCTNADLDGDGACTAVDVQRVSNAVAGLGCLVGPGGPATISSVSPGSIAAGSGTFSLTVLGGGFYQGGSGAAVVSWNGTRLNTSVVGFTQSAAQLSVTVPGNLIPEPGTATLSVTSGGTTSGLFNYPITAPAPVLTSITPNNGAPGTSVSVTLSGNYFLSNARVSTDSPYVTGTNVNVVSFTQATATLVIASNAVIETVDVIVSTSSGSSSSVPFAVTKPSAPTLTSTTPGSAPQGGSVPVTLTGTNFTSGATVAVANPGVTVSNVNVVSQTQITATFTVAAGASVGATSVTVTTAGGTSSAASFSVTAPAPTVTSVSPSTGTQGATVVVTLTGDHFVSGATVAVANPGITVSNVSVVSPTQITATFAISASASAGPTNVTVSTSAGASTPGSFTVAAAPPTFPTVSVSGGEGSTVSPLGTKSFTIVLPAASSSSSSGSLGLQFTGNAVNPVTTDPEVSFVSGTTPVPNVTFSFPPGQTQAVLSPAGATVQAGTVAGTVSVLITSYQGVTPPNQILGTVTIPRIAPQITNIKLANKTASGFDVCVSGFSTSRDMTGVTYQFNGSGQGTLQTAQLTAGASLVGLFTSWFQSSSSVASGGQFLLDQTFNITGPDTAIGSISVTLQNASGTITSATVPYSGFAASCN